LKRSELYARLRTSDQEALTIVLLCGLGFHTFEYEPLAESLAASGYNALSFDYRGHGRSDGPRGRWSLADLQKQSQILFDAANGASEYQLVDTGHLPHLENTGLLTKQLVDRFDNTA